MIARIKNAIAQYTNEITKLAKVSAEYVSGNRLLAKKTLFAGGVLIITLGIGLHVYNSPQPLRLIPANIGSQSVSLVFFTGEKTNACMYVYKESQMLKGRWACDSDATTHVLSVDNLEPETRYKTILKTGGRWTRKSLPIITTLPLSETPPGLPEPAYGSVVDENQRPVPDALVIVIPDKDLSKAIVTKTNVQGNFSVDVSAVIENANTLIVDVQTIGGLWANTVFPKDIHTPFSTLVVKPIVKLDNT